MKILVVGGGAREHVIVKALRKNPGVTEIFAAPGNGGIAADAKCVDIAATDIDAMVRFARERAIDFAVVAPDDPLVLGMVDALESVGVPSFGPDKKAAIIEGSKVFSKELMKKYGIPTAAYEVFTDMSAALEYLETAPIPTVIKADGLALGKGVTVAMTREEAVDAVRAMMGELVFGASGARIVIEEFLEGPEVSVLSFTDGETLVPLVSSMDHKRALDNDEGPNTGGMGAVAPNPFYTAALADECMARIFRPTVRAMNAEGRPFKGCLYFGLMLTKNGPKVIEYNCRFGDPEIQVVLPLLETDLLDIMLAVRNGTLADMDIRSSDGAACSVVLASKGYPGHYEKGFRIGLPALSEHENIFVAGAKRQDGELVTNGGRVLGAVGVGETLEAAVARAYTIAEGIACDELYYRRDIGRRALAAKGDA